MSEVIKLEIEITAPPDGWGDVKYRQVSHGEIVKYWDGKEWRQCLGQTSCAYPIARKLAPLWTPPPQWHAMFGDCWLTRDRENNYLIHKTEPDLFCDHGIWEGGLPAFCVEPFRPELFPPADIPWQQCCFKIEDPTE